MKVKALFLACLLLWGCPQSSGQREVESRIKAAIEVFMARDRELLSIDVNERSLSHRLAMHLQSCFGVEWDVDCEYNREGLDGDPKRLDLPVESTTTDCLNARTVLPDIIVHKRGPDGPNLLVLELKKSGCDGAAIEYDRRKLHAYLEKPSLRYEHAVFLTVTTGDSPKFGEPEPIYPN